MQHHTTVRSPGAIALGTLCAVGTLVVLFWYVRSPADFTLNHVYILLALAVTYGAGHFMWDAYGERAFGGFVRGLAFSLLFMVGTTICVALSGGRSAEILEHKEADASHENAKRASQEAKVLSANQDRKETKDAADKAQATADKAAAGEQAECADGPGSKCRDKRVTATAAAAKATDLFKRAKQADSDYWMEVARLNDLKPAQVANAELKTFAKVLAHVRSVDEETAMASVMLLLPYGLALLTEFGSIVFFKHGFGRRKVAKATPATAGKPELPTVARQPLPETDGRGGRMTKRQAEQFLVTHLALHGSIESQDWLAAKAGVNKGTISKWMRDWVRRGLVTRAQAGRCKMIESA
jgi:hypothetical protein